MNLKFGYLYFWGEQEHLGFLRSLDFHGAALNQPICSGMQIFSSCSVCTVPRPSSSSQTRASGYLYHTRRYEQVSRYPY